MTVPNIKVKLVRRPTIKLKVLPRFPGTVSANSPIVVSTAGGNYDFSLDVASIFGDGTAGYHLQANGTGAEPLWSGFLQSGTGALTRTWQDKARDILNIKDFAGVDPTGAADSLAGIQAALNANPNRTFQFGDSANTYKCSGPILLVDTAGHNFQGSLIAEGATITFTNAGLSTDTDAAMQHGFQVYPKTNAVGGDVTGALNVTIKGFNINCPTNGAGIYLANSQQCSILDNTFGNGRYSIALENSINFRIQGNRFFGFINAGVGLIYSGDTARVWYGSAGSPTGAYWNDSPQIIGNLFSASVTGGLAHILDMGSATENVRNIQGNVFYSNPGCNKYGYLGRNCNPVLLSNWSENVDYPIRFLNTNALEGGAGTTLTGVTGAQPSGTYTVGAIPDSGRIASTCRIENNFFALGVNDINLSGVSGTAQIGGNISSGLTGFHLVSSLSTQKIIDSGDSVIFPSGGVYTNITFPTRINLAATVPWTAFTPTVGAGSGAFTTVSATGRFCVDPTGTTHFQMVITITTNGTAAGNITATLPSTAVNAHVANGRETGTGTTIAGQISAGSATMTIFKYDNTYPGATGSFLVINGFYN